MSLTSAYLSRLIERAAAPTLQVRPRPHHRLESPVRRAEGNIDSGAKQRFDEVLETRPTPTDNPSRRGHLGTLVEMSQRVADDGQPTAGAGSADRIGAGPATSEHGNASSVSPLPSLRTARGAIGHRELGEVVESRRTNRTQPPIGSMAGGDVDEPTTDASRPSRPEPDGDDGPSPSTVKPRMSARRGDPPERPPVREAGRVLPGSGESAGGTSDPATGRGGRRRSSVDEVLGEGQHAAAPTVHVTIGRIEVRAVAPQSGAERAATGPVVLPLEQYLRERVAARQR